MSPEGLPPPPPPAASPPAATEAAPAPLATPSQPWGFPNFRALAKRPSTSRLPIFVMLPLDTVTRDGVLTNTKALSVGFAVRPNSRRRLSAALARLQRTPAPRLPRAAPDCAEAHHPASPRRR